MFGKARRILRNRDSHSRRKLSWYIKADVCDGRHWTETLGAQSETEGRMVEAA